MAPLPAAWSIDYTDTQKCTTIEGCVGESAAESLSLRLLFYVVWVEYALGDDHSFGGRSDDTWSGGWLDCSTTL